MIEYLSVEQVVELHDVAAGASPVLDLDTLTSAVLRPQAGFGGQDAHPTVFDKAAALLHGLASTQCFEDGNKRAAWAAAVVFLEVNGHELPDIPEIAAEAFAVAVATSAWTDRTVAKAAEWFHVHASLQPS